MVKYCYVEINHNYTKIFTAYAMMDDDNNILEFYEYVNLKTNILLDKTDVLSNCNANNVCIPSIEGFNIASTTLQKVFNTQNNHFNITNMVIRTYFEGELKIGNIYYQYIDDPTLKYYLYSTGCYCILSINLLLVTASNIVIYAYNIDNMCENILLNGTICNFICNGFDMNNLMEIKSLTLQKELNTNSNIFYINANMIYDVNNTLIKMGNISIKQINNPNIIDTYIELTNPNLKLFVKSIDNTIIGCYEVGLCDNKLLYSFDNCNSTSDNIYPITNNGFNFVSNTLTTYYSENDNRFNLNAISLKHYGNVHVPEKMSIVEMQNLDLYLVGTELTIVGPDMNDLIVTIENVKVGNLVKTYQSGYKRVLSIKKQYVFNGVYKTTINNNVIYTTGTKLLLLYNLTQNEKTKNNVIYCSKYMISVSNCDSSQKLCDDNCYEMYYISLDNNGRRSSVFTNNVVTIITSDTMCGLLNNI